MFSYNKIINFTELVTSYVSHGKSFSQICTNFRFDEDLHVDAGCLQQNHRLLSLDL